MVPKEWLEVAQVLGTVAAGCGLAFTACQMLRARRVADLQALQTFSGHVIEREAALGDAEDDVVRVRAFNEFLNLLQLYACAYNEGLFIGHGSRKMVRLKLIDSVVELDHFKEWHPQIEKALDRSTTFEELTKFIKRHKKEIAHRKAERARREQAA